MRNLFLMSLLFLVGFTTFGQDSLAVSKETYMAARKTMKMVESTHLKTNTDAKAVELINTAKEASNAGMEYLTTLPGYKVAIQNSVENKEALKEFKAKVKAEDETYIALAKNAQVAQKAKRDYLISSSPEYKQAWDDYMAYNKTK